MKKFCPSCGKPVDSNMKFCPHCGKALNSKDNQPEQQLKRSELRQRPAKKKGLSKKSVIGIIVAVIVLVMAGGFGIYYYNQNSTSSSVIGGNGRLSDAQVKKIPRKQLSAWAILYANKKYGKKWGEAADQLRNGSLTIETYPKYRFGEYEITATDGNTLYVVNKSIGYLISEDKDEITYVGNHSGYSKVSVLNQIYPVIKDENTDANVNKWNNNLTISAGKAEENENSQSSAKTSSHKKTSSKLWSDKQNSELISYMGEFGDKMHQPYDYYSSNNDEIVTRAGEHYPSILNDTDYPFKLSSGDHDSRRPEDMESISLQWNPNVTTESNNSDTYNVVAIFNYNGRSAEDHITYLFCFYQGEPVALVDQTTNGGYVIVHPTANQDLTAHFNKIAENN